MSLTFLPATASLITCSMTRHMGRKKMPLFKLLTHARFKLTEYFALNMN